MMEYVVYISAIEKEICDHSQHLSIWKSEAHKPFASGRMWFLKWDSRIISVWTKNFKAVEKQMLHGRLF